MDTQIIVAILGFATAGVGLLAAVLGRKKEVVHRHVRGEEPSKSAFTAIGCLGVLILAAGVVVGSAAIIAHFPFGKKTPEVPNASPAGKLLAGPREGRLVIKASPHTGVVTERSGVAIRDGVLEATFYVPPVSQKEIIWMQGFLFRMTETGNWGVFVCSDGHWESGGFGFEGKGKWRSGQRVNLPEGWLATKKGDRNRLKVVLDGNKGKLFLNNHFVADFDASEIMAPGDVAVAFNMASYGTQLREPLEAFFEDFRVVELR